MNVIFCCLRYIVVDGFKLIQHVLDSLHKHRLQALGEGVWIIGIILSQRQRRLGLRRDDLFPRLALQNELGDREHVPCRRCVLRGSVVLFTDVVQYFAYDVANGVLYEWYSW